MHRQHRGNKIGNKASAIVMAAVAASAVVLGLAVLAGCSSGSSSSTAAATQTATVKGPNSLLMANNLLEMDASDLDTYLTGLGFTKQSDGVYDSGTKEADGISSITGASNVHVEFTPADSPTKIVITIAYNTPAASIYATNQSVLEETSFGKPFGSADGAGESFYEGFCTINKNDGIWTLDYTESTITLSCWTLEAYGKERGIDTNIQTVEKSNADIIQRLQLSGEEAEYASSTASTTSSSSTSSTAASTSTSTAAAVNPKDASEAYTGNTATGAGAIGDQNVDIADGSISLTGMTMDKYSTGQPSISGVITVNKDVTADNLQITYTFYDASGNVLGTAGTILGGPFSSGDSAAFVLADLNTFNYADVAEYRCTQMSFM